ncbi:hypothetical protein FSP39_002505 [Pinctada imbricata]|uniref:Sphingomyelin synthase-like domain-containing protein n=1 Tax=Pinctada imbricata TaxID=66713 RepID=A0AA89BYI5_PINIB|nr:hypothetical protein FSP39_002505 [Pinctada imbricata]
MEAVKLVVSLLYVVFAQLFMCFTAIVVTDRLPNRTKYQPLPDVVLDNTPYIPWGSDTAEICLVTLNFMAIMMAVFHKERSLLLRRFSVLAGNLAFLRSACIFVTSAPVADVNEICIVKPEDSFGYRLLRACRVLVRMGYTSMGSAQCGDYIFSGHTMIMTLCNLFLNEYTHKRMHVIRILGWILNFAGMLFLILGRSHYTVDVILGFYITVAMTNNYHLMARSESVLSKRKIYHYLIFPLMTLFVADNQECRVKDKKVQNNFDIFTNHKEKKCDEKILVC